MVACFDLRQADDRQADDRVRPVAGYRESEDFGALLLDELHQFAKGKVLSCHGDGDYRAGGSDVKKIGKCLQQVVFVYNTLVDSVRVANGQEPEFVVQHEPGDFEDVLMAVAIDRRIEAECGEWDRFVGEVADGFEGDLPRGFVGLCVEYGEGVGMPRIHFCNGGSCRILGCEGTECWVD